MSILLAASSGGADWWYVVVTPRRVFLSDNFSRFAHGRPPWHRPSRPGRRAPGTVRASQGGSGRRANNLSTPSRATLADHLDFDPATQAHTHVHTYHIHTSAMRWTLYKVVVKPHGLSLQT